LKYAKDSVDIKQVYKNQTKVRKIKCFDFALIDFNSFYETEAYIYIKILLVIAMH